MQRPATRLERADGRVRSRAACPGTGGLGRCSCPAETFGNAFDIILSAINAQGGAATGLAGKQATLQVVSTPPGATLSGPTTATFDSNGNATFSGMVASATGAYEVILTDVYDGLTFDFKFDVFGRF